MDPKKKSLAATERNEEHRAEFKANQPALELDKLVVLDECGTHIGLTPNYGWAPRNQRAYDTVPRNRGQNLTLICAITTTHGLGGNTAMLLDGATDRLAFEAYIEQVLAPHLERGQTVIMDNLSSHKSVKVQEILAAKGCKVLFLPAYSPDLSPIELAFSKLKQKLRRVGARTRESLETAIGQALEAVTPEDATAYFRHCGYS